MQNFNILASLCSRADWCEPYLVTSSDTDFLTSRAHIRILKRIIVRLTELMMMIMFKKRKDDNNYNNDNN